MECGKPWNVCFDVRRKHRKNGNAICRPLVEGSNRIRTFHILDVFTAYLMRSIAKNIATRPFQQVFYEFLQ